MCTLVFDTEITSLSELRDGDKLHGALFETIHDQENQEYLIGHEVEVEIEVNHSTKVVYAKLTFSDEERTQHLKQRYIIGEREPPKKPLNYS